MQKLFFSALTLSLLLLSGSARADEITNRTSVDLNTGRPDDRTNLRIRNTTTFTGADLEQSVTTGYTQFFDSGDSIGVSILEYSVKDELGTATVTGTLGIALADGNVYPQVRFSAALPIQIGGDIPNAQLSGEVSYQLLDESPAAVERGLTKLTLSPRLRWQLDPRTNALVIYQLASISDGNLQQRVNLRVEHQLGDGFYIAPVVSYLGNTVSSDDYWTPESRVTAGVEGGVQFPLSRSVACRVGIQPGVAIEEATEFRFGGGGGCKFSIGENTRVEARVVAGYGVNARVEVRQRL